MKTGYFFQYRVGYWKGFGSPAFARIEKKYFTIFKKCLFAGSYSNKKGRQVFVNWRCGVVLICLLVVGESNKHFDNINISMF